MASQLDEERARALEKSEELQQACAQLAVAQQQQAEQDRDSQLQVSTASVAILPSGVIHVK